MSWQSYVDQNMVGTKKITAAGIFGHDKSAWAVSSGFNANPQELEKLYSAYKDASGIRANGLYINGKKYIALRCDDRSIYGKLVIHINVGFRWSCLCKNQPSCINRCIR